MATKEARKTANGNPLPLRVLPARPVGAATSRRQDTPLRRFCGPETRAHVRRNLRRSLAPYLRLAKAIIAGETPID
jgi:hypothetical protein